VLALQKKEFAVLAAGLPDVRRSFDQMMERRGMTKAGAAPST
jgi:hypothetical protein